MEKQENKKRARPTREQVAKRTISRLKRFTEHIESGRPVCEAYSCRKIILDIESERYTPEMVKEARMLLNVSQSLFAMFLNVSASSVQKWERGAATPDGAVCRLLDEIRHDPEHWRKRFMSMARRVAAPAPR